MIRLTELKLPLDSAFNPPDKVSAPPLYPPTLAPLIAATLGISMEAIAEWKVFKRSFDARQKLQVVYIVDVQLHDSSKAQQLLQQHLSRHYLHRLFQIPIGLHLMLLLIEQFQLQMVLQGLQVCLLILIMFLTQKLQLIKQ